LRHRLADEPSRLATTVHGAWRAHASETLTAEILPLLDAMRFLEREAPTILAPRATRSALGARPLWLVGSTLDVRREPLGVVLVLGPANYPIFLPGVQAMQALVAGNTVIVKPGRDGLDAMRCLRAEAEAAGLPPGVLQVLSESIEDGELAIDAGVDKVVVTGSLDTGRAVLGQLADGPTPSVLELSGHDAVIVRDDTRLDLAAEAIAFGLGLNGGFTCIAPRRILAVDLVASTLEARLAAALRDRPPVRLVPGVRERLVTLLDDAVRRGGRFVAGGPPAGGPALHDYCPPILLADVPPSASIVGADIPAPVATLEAIDDDDAAARIVAAAPYRLGAAIFGRPPAARALARRLDVGVVVVNDLIVPTADPRVPFGGRGCSGFGATRGAEGLLEMTTHKAVLVRSGRVRPHYEPVGPEDAALFDAAVRMQHGSSLARRWRALLDLIRVGKARRGAAS
ncbi:MAG: aldehyde dehydrogenase family protein, partial [Acidobacteriota bacterium]